METPTPRDPALLEFAEIARRFCVLVETAEASRAPEILHEMHVALARLYLGALLLPGANALMPDEDDDAAEDTGLAAVSNEETSAALSAYGQVARRLSGVFGARDIYREVFDPYASDSVPEVSGSLSDDVADIYGHIREGLDLWDGGAFGAALFEWRFGFECHWSEHATGAIRALFARSTWYDMGWPQRGL